VTRGIVGPDPLLHGGAVTAGVVDVVRGDPNQV